MKRLTEKQNGEYILPYDGENLLSISTLRNTIMFGDFKWVTTPNITYLSGKFINKLGELEDVLEKYKIKNLEEYISALNEARNFAIKERSAMFNKYIKETIKTEELETELAELKQQLEEKEKDSQFLKKMYVSERIKNDNYHTEKYGLDKPVQELRKIKLNPKEKEIYYKGFDNCERQFATHIAELQQQLKSQPAEIVEKIRKQIFNHFNVNNMEEYESLSMLDSLFTADAVTDILDDILKEYQK